MITFLLNYSALFLFWKNFFKDDFLSFLGSIFFIFSPFFIKQLGHFQIMSYWPMFFSLYFLTKDNFNFKVKNVFIAGIFLAIQFLASVYLAIFLCFVSGIWFLIGFSRKNVKHTLLPFLIYFLTFFILDGFFIKGYIETKNIYKIKRPINEYILYSAHITDYLFSDTPSLIYQSTLMKKWNSFDHHIVGEKAAFPGFLFSILFLLGFFTFIKVKNKKLIGFEFTKEKIFFLLIIIIGFVFSLGPRLNVNGVYAHIPLPSYLFLKFLPMFDTIRGSARWSFLVYFGILFFILLAIKNILNSEYKFVIPIIFMIFIMEYLPVEIRATSEKIINSDYQKLSELCNKNVLLEIPYTHLFGVDGGVVDGLKYISKVELASLKHNCMLVNGYSGYDLPENIAYFQTLTKSLEDSDYNFYLRQLKKRNVRYIKYNDDYVNEMDRKKYIEMFDFLVKSKKFKKITNSIYEVN